MCCSTQLLSQRHNAGTKSLNTSQLLLIHGRDFLPGLPGGTYRRYHRYPHCKNFIHTSIWTLFRLSFIEFSDNFIKKTAFFYPIDNKGEGKLD